MCVGGHPATFTTGSPASQSPAADLHTVRPLAMRPCMLRHLVLENAGPLLALALSLGGCTVQVTPPTIADMAGSYAATTFTTSANGMTQDRLAAGASVTLTLTPSRTTTGRLYVPGGADDGSDLDADLRGTWSLGGYLGNTVTLSHAADTFLRDMDFIFYSGDRSLRGEGTFGSSTVRVILERS